MFSPAPGPVSTIHPSPPSVSTPMRHGRMEAASKDRRLAVQFGRLRAASLEKNAPIKAPTQKVRMSTSQFIVRN